MAHNIALQEKVYLEAIGAWFGQSVQATTGKGKNIKSKYKKFEDFYDYDKEFNKIFNPPSEDKRKQIAMANMAMNRHRTERRVN